MARKRPSIAPVVYDNVQYEFIALDIGDSYEGECPRCSATVTAHVEGLSFHRDGTFSTTAGYPIECPGCDLTFRVERGTGVEYIGPRAERRRHDRVDEAEWDEDGDAA